MTLSGFRCTHDRFIMYYRIYIYINWYDSWGLQQSGGTPVVIYIDNIYMGSNLSGIYKPY